MMRFLCGLAVGFGILSAQSKLAVSLVEDSVLENALAHFPLANDERQQRMDALFRGAKCPELYAVPLGKKPVPATIVCVWPGEQAAAIVVGAHFDKVKAGEGKIDNGTGSVLLPYLMEALHREKRRHTFIYAAFAEEEVGLLGSQALVKKGIPGREGKALVASTKAMVNLDSLGLGETAIGVSNSDAFLVAKANVIAQALRLPLRFINVDLVGISDGRSFSSKQVPAIEFHSLDQETFPILHTNQDTMKALKMEQLARSYRLLAFYLAHLDTSLEQRDEFIARQRKEK